MPGVKSLYTQLHANPEPPTPLPPSARPPPTTVTGLAFTCLRNHHSNSGTILHGPCCPLLTRGRLMMMLTISLLSTLLLLLQCVQPGLFHDGVVCCGQEKGAFQQVLIQTKEQARGGRQELEAGDDEEEEEEDDDEEEVHDHTRIRYKHTKRRLPQSIIIGVRKGGTRALLEFLNMHPSVQAEKREMHFFDDDFNYSKGIDWYRKKMPWSYSDQITIEKTPNYFIVDEVPHRMKQTLNDTKILLVVRNPIDRTLSDYMQIHSSKLKKGQYHQPFEELVIDAETGQVDKGYKAIRRSMYAKHMDRWLKFFTLDQFHIVNGENLVRNPVDELRKIETFLGIEHRLTSDHFYFNQTRGFYCMKLKDKEKCLAPSKGRAHPTVDGFVLEKLRDFFRPYNEKFYNMVGVNFGWN